MAGMSAWDAILEKQGFIILDGGLASELERRGADLDDPLWSALVLLENPQLIEEVHYDFFAAGADAATTATYQATLNGLKQRGLSTEAARNVYRESVRLASDARDRIMANDSHSRRPKPLIAASIGCFGASLHDGSEYHGDYGVGKRQLVDFHQTQIEVLEAAGGDLLAFETIPSLLEAKAIVEALAGFPHVNAWLSFSCRDNEHLCHGEPLVRAIEVANDCGQIVAAGVNCTAPDFVAPLLKQAQSATKRPLIAYPNRGEAWDAAKHRWQADGQQPDLASLAPEWLSRGARWIGGCCRVTPRDIRAIRRAIDQACKTN